MRRRRKTFALIENLATHPEQNLAPEQLAAWWGVSVQTVRKWVNDAPAARQAGEPSLEGFRVGRALRVRRDVALAFEEAGKLRAAS